MDSLSSHSFENLGAGRQFSETKGGGGVFLYSVREFKGTGVSNQLEKKEE